MIIPTCLTCLKLSDSSIKVRFSPSSLGSLADGARVTLVASHYERHIADHTSALRSLELQKAFVDLKDRLVVPGRRLVREGAAHSNHHHQDARKLSLHLFTDVLLVGCNKASSIEKGLHVEAWMPVETLTVIKIQDAERLSLEVRSVQASFVLRFGPPSYPS